MANYEDLEEYLHGLKISDYLTQSDVNDILRDYRKWDKTCLDEDFYFYDDIKYEHSNEYNLKNYRELCDSAKSIKEPFIKVEVNNDEVMTIATKINTVVVLVCTFDIKNKKYKIKSSVDKKVIKEQGLKESDFESYTETYKSITDMLNEMYSYFEELNIQKFNSAYESFFDIAFELFPE